MAIAGDERVPYEGCGAGKGFFQSLMKNLKMFSTHQGGNLDGIGISELEQILIQKPFTRSEIERLIELLHSRITEESPSDAVMVERDGAKLSTPPNSPSYIIRLEASGTLKKPKHGDKRDNFHASSVFSSKVVEEHIASPANAYKGSELFNNKATAGLPKTLKASPQLPATMENLPEKLLSNIFIRLFAKQLAQMRSVSKSWNALLSHSSFIKSHLHRSIHNTNHLLPFYNDTSFTSSEPFTVHTCHRQSSYQKLTNFIKLSINPPFENAYANLVRVIGSVNGLICYSHSDSPIHIWKLPSLPC